MSCPNDVEYRLQELSYSLHDGEMIIGQQNTRPSQLGLLVHG